MVAHPFFCLKIGHFKATIRTVAHRCNIKTGSPDPADFAKTRRLLPRRHIALRRLQYAKVAQTMERTANIHHLVFCTNYNKSVIHFLRLWQFAQWLCDLGISQLAQTPSRSKSAGSGDPVFTLMDALLCGP
jgi:hypothetical protein